MLHMCRGGVRWSCNLSLILFISMGWFLTLCMCFSRLQDDIYIASSQAVPEVENNHAISELSKRYSNIKYRNTQETQPTSSSSDHQIRIYKMSLQKMSLDRSPKARLPDVRTPLSALSDTTFDFPSPSVEEKSLDVLEPHETRPRTSLSSNNLSRPYSWTVQEDNSSRIDAEFRDLIECHQGGINCI